MSTSEADRYHLFETVRDRFDDERAAGTLMSLLPPDRDALATKTDVGAVTALSKANLDAAMAKSKADLDAAMAKSKANLDAATAKSKTDLDTAVQRLDVALQRLDDRIVDQGRTMMLAMMGSWLTLVALIVSLRFA